MLTRVNHEYFLALKPNQIHHLSEYSQKWNSRATSTKLGTSISSEANTQNTKHCGLVAIKLGPDKNL